MNRKLKVVLVDDNLAFLEGLEALLETDDRFEVMSPYFLPVKPCLTITN
jgi:hypothetical protein